MNLIILTHDDIPDNNRYRITDFRAEHIFHILKAQVGDTVEIGTLDGLIGSAVIERISENEVILHCPDLKPQPPPTPTVDLICALPRPQTLKKALWTTASMGVRRLYLIRANRVEKSYFHSPLLQPEKYMPYLIEGLSQGKLTRLPEVYIFDRFRKFFEDELPDLENNETTKAIKLLPDPSANSILSEIYTGNASQRLLIAIGPEGGWVPFEIELMEKSGFQRFTLGRWILRVETAIAAVLSQVELVRMQST